MHDPSGPGARRSRDEAGTRFGTDSTLATTNARGGRRVTSEQVRARGRGCQKSFIPYPGRGWDASESFGGSRAESASSTTPAVPGTGGRAEGNRLMRGGGGGGGLYVWLFSIMNIGARWGAREDRTAPALGAGDPPMEPDPRSTGRTPAPPSIPINRLPRRRPLKQVDAHAPPAREGTRATGVRESRRSCCTRSIPSAFSRSHAIPVNQSSRLSIHSVVGANDDRSRFGGPVPAR